MFYSLFSNHLFRKVSLKISNLHLFPQVIEIFPFVRVALTTFLLSMNFDNCLSAGILSQINSLLNYIYLRFSNNLSWTVCDSSFGRILSLKEFNFSSLGLNFRERGVQYHGAPLRTDKMEKEPLVKFTQIEFFHVCPCKEGKRGNVIVYCWFLATIL